MLFDVILVSMKILLNACSLQTLTDPDSPVGKSSGRCMDRESVPHP